MDYASRLRDWRWRINNLYKITDEHGHKITFKMNEVQEEIFAGLHNKNVILKARQYGVTTFMCIFLLDVILFNPDVEVGMIAQTLPLSQNIFDKKVKFAYENLPESIRLLRPAIKMDGCQLQVEHPSVDGGLSKSSFFVNTSMRSGTLQYLHVSEMGKIAAANPAKADEIISGALNAGASCVVTVESTAEGAFGVFFDMCQNAEHHVGKLTKMDYRFFFFPWYRHPSYVLDDPEITIPDTYRKYFDEEVPIELSHAQEVWYYKKHREQGTKMWQEFPSTPEEAFKVALKGAYYKIQLNLAYDEERIHIFPYDPTHRVHTSWDIGHNDSTAIWFFQVIDGDPYIIDCYENDQWELDDYLDHLETMHYNFGYHFGPHDMENRTFKNKMTCVEIALDRGFQFTVLDKIRVSEGINFVRKTLHRCRFDKDKTTRGVDALSAYRKEKDRSGQWKNTPYHDWSSNFADSFRYLCQALTVADFEAIELGGGLLDDCFY